MMTIASILCWVGHFMTELNFIERSLFFISTAAVAAFLILRNPVLCAVSVITFFVGIIVQLYKLWKLKKMPTFQG
jgi:hypothetical protein